MAKKITPKVKNIVQKKPRDSYKEGLLSMHLLENDYDKLFDRKIAEEYRQFRNFKEHKQQMQKFIRILAVLIIIILVALLLLTFG